MTGVRDLWLLWAHFPCTLSPITILAYRTLYNSRRMDRPCPCTTLLLAQWVVSPQWAQNHRYGEVKVGLPCLPEPPPNRYQYLRPACMFYFCTVQFCCVLHVFLLALIWCLCLLQLLQRNPVCVCTRAMLNDQSPWCFHSPIFHTYKS